MKFINYIKSVNLCNPRDIIFNKEKMYVSCLGDRITLKELYYFNKPRPRGIVIYLNKIYITVVLEFIINVYSLDDKYDFYFDWDI